MRDQRLHDAVLAAPDDDGPRLVYADWLSERGDPRGELIQVQIARDHGGGELAEREAELWRVHGEEWRAPYADLEVGLVRGFAERLKGRVRQLVLATLDDACIRTLDVWPGLAMRGPDD